MAAQALLRKTCLNKSCKLYLLPLVLKLSDATQPDSVLKSLSPDFAHQASKEGDQGLSDRSQEFLTLRLQKEFGHQQTGPC